MKSRIETGRLRIVPFERKYLEAYCSEFDEEITRYQYPEPFGSPEAADEGLRGFVDQMARDEMLFLTILTLEGEFVGGVEVHGLREEYPEIGIWIKKRAQRKGYAYEALSSVLEFVEANYQKGWFVYEADIRNAGSMRLVEKFEYRRDGDVDAFETETGKDLRLQRFLVRAAR